MASAWVDYRDFQQDGQSWSGNRIPPAALRPGHGLKLYRTKSGRVFAHCTCGWLSTTRTTERDAVGAGVHHVKLIRQRRRENGWVDEVPPSARASHPSAKVSTGNEQSRLTRSDTVEMMESKVRQSSPARPR